MVIKALDPDWIRIRIGVHPKMLNPDPDEMNADPQPCLRRNHPGCDIPYVVRLIEGNSKCRHLNSAILDTIYLTTSQKDKTHRRQCKMSSSQLCHPGYDMPYVIRLIEGHAKCRHLNSASLGTIYGTLRRRKMRLIESNAKCRHPKKMTFKGTLRQVFICLRPWTPWPYPHPANPRS